MAVTQLSTLFSLRSSLHVLEKDKASLYPSASSSCTNNTQLLRNCCHCKCIQTAHAAEQKLFPIQTETKVISSLQNQTKYKHTGTVGGTGTGSTGRHCTACREATHGRSRQEMWGQRDSSDTSSYTALLQPCSLQQQEPLQQEIPAKQLYP